jgi:hypothetical protein
MEIEFKRETQSSQSEPTEPAPEPNLEPALEPALSAARQLRKVVRVPSKRPKSDEPIILLADPSPEAYDQLCKECRTPEHLGAIIAHAKKKLDALEYVQVLVRVIGSGKYANDRELLDEIVGIYEKEPDSIKKLESLVDTTTAVNERCPQCVEPLSAQVVQLGAKLAARSLDEGPADQAYRTIDLARFGDLKVRTCLEAVAYTQRHAAVQTLLTKAVREASSPLFADHRQVQSDLFGDIEALALETGAFEDVDFAVLFIEEYARLPDAKAVQRAQEIIDSLKSPLDRIQVLTQLLASSKFTLGSEFVHMIHAVYEEIPTSAEKLASLVDTANTLRDCQPRYSTQFLTQAIELGSALIVGYIEEGSSDKVCKVIDLMRSADGRIEAAVDSISQTEKQGIGPELLAKVVQIASLLLERRDLQANLFKAAKSGALKTESFSDAGFAAQFISEYVQIPGVEPLPEVEGVLSSVGVPLVKLDILCTAIPKIKQRLAGDLAWQSFELIRDASLSWEVRKQSLRRIFSLCENQHLLANQELCRELTLALVDTGEFQDARKALSQNKAVCRDVALRTSDRTPGFSLYALNHALESDRNLPYSEQHAQILAKITRQVAEYSPRMAYRVWEQSIKVARELALKSAVSHQKRLDFYKRSCSPSNPRVFDPANARSGTNGSNQIAVRIVLDTEFRSFVENKERLFIESLADMLRLSPEDVYILDKSAGSAVYVLKLALQGASFTLKRKFEEQDEDILRLQETIDAPVESVEIMLITPEQVAAVQKPAVAARAGITEIEPKEKTRGLSAIIHVKSSTGAEADSNIILPYDESQLTTILKVLEERSLENHDMWKSTQIETIYRFGLMEEPELAANLWDRIKIYFRQAFTSGESERVLQFFQRKRLLTILKAFSCQALQTHEPWEPYQVGILWEMNLVDGASLVSDYLGRVGDAIYDDGLASGKDVYHILQSSIDESRSKDIAWQLKLSKNDTHLARYPWELMGNEHRHLLMNSSLRLDLARSVLLCRAARPFSLSLPLNILYIESRPYISDRLPGAQRRIIEDVLQDSIQRGEVDLEVLSTSRGNPAESPPTYPDICDRLSTKEYHVVHFDGHGQFGRQCPKCGRLYYPQYETCAKGCHARLDEPLGFLQLEDLFKQREWVNSNDLHYLLDGTSIRLVILSACFSGTIYGETIFSGVAPALLERGIPSVVGMQFSIYDEHANTFVETFYRNLTRSGNVRRAIQAGRQKLLREKSWYIPVLYLRTLDATGQLFTPGG